MIRVTYGFRVQEGKVKYQLSNTLPPPPSNNIFNKNTFFYQLFFQISLLLFEKIGSGIECAGSDQSYVIQKSPRRLFPGGTIEVCK